MMNDMIDVWFEHWQYTFLDEMLSRFGSRYYSPKEARNTSWRLNEKDLTRSGRHSDSAPEMMRVVAYGQGRRRKKPGLSNGTTPLHG